ncbi:MAG: adenylate/guanylate cyclase domain-containing protein [Alphaproteobacteria bacterium]|jgi:adenylate cyclase
MSPRIRSIVLTWFVALGVSMGLGTTYAWIAGGRPIVGLFNGAAIGGIIAAFELFYVERPWGVPLRRLSLKWFIGIMTLSWVIIISGVLWGANTIFGHPWGATPEMHPHSNLIKDALVVFAFGFLVNFGLRVQSLVGPNVLFNFLLGTYHRPQREHRAVVFIDLADSTAIAEKLGDLRVQELIARFFFDIARAIDECRGEIHRYIGDAVVLTWPLEIAMTQNLPLKCVIEIQNLIDGLAPRYMQEFGIVPRFRTGVHVGTIVAGEVGDDRREIVYIGNTMNTAARLQQACKELKQDVLVSGEFLKLLPPPPGIDAEDLGMIDLPGKSQRIHIFGLSRAATASNQQK